MPISSVRPIAASDSGKKYGNSLHIAKPRDQRTKCPLSAHLDCYVAAPGQVKYSNERPLSEDCSVKATDDAVPMNDRAEPGGRLTQLLESNTWPKMRPRSVAPLRSISPRQPFATGLSDAHSGLFPPHQIPPHHRIRLMGFMVGQINGDAVFPFNISILRGRNGSAETRGIAGLWSEFPANKENNREFCEIRSISLDILHLFL